MYYWDYALIHSVMCLKIYYIRQNKTCPLLFLTQDFLQLKSTTHCKYYHSYIETLVVKYFNILVYSVPTIIYIIKFTGNSGDCYKI